MWTYPRKALTFLINRFTKQGDTVASVGAESNACVEVALGRGRRLEAFVGKESARDGVEERARESFVAAYAEGFFKAAA